MPRIQAIAATTALPRVSRRTRSVPARARAPTSGTTTAEPASPRNILGLLPTRGDFRCPQERPRCGRHHGEVTHLPRLRPAARSFRSLGTPLEKCEGEKRDIPMQDANCNAVERNQHRLHRPPNIPREVTAGQMWSSARRRPPSAPACVSADDRELVERLLAGEEAPFIGLVSRYHGSLLRLARAFVGSHNAAEDVVQETWLAVLNGLDSFEDRGTLKGWIFRILVNRANTRGQRDERWAPLSDDAEDLEDEAAVDGRRFSAGGWWAQPPERWVEKEPEELLLRREAQHVLECPLTELPPAQRAVVIMRDIEGLPAKEVCSALQVSDVHQRVLLHRGRSKLRADIEKALASTSRLRP